MMKTLACRQPWGSIPVLVLGLCLLASPCLALDVPPLTGRIVDLASLLSAESQAQLTARLAEHEQSTGNQVAVLVIPSLKGEDLFTFSHRVATTWQLGQKGTDNGVLLLVAVKDRKIRIEVGYGLEGALTDARSAQIIRNEIVPRFRAGDMAGGLTAGLEAILASLSGTYQAPAQARDSGTTDVGLHVFLALLLGVVIGLILSGAQRTLGPLAGGVVSFLSAPWLGPALFAGLAALAIVATLRSLLDHTPRSGRPGRTIPDDGWWYSSHSGGWGGSGGDIGFSGGGGDFGGGGASGDW